MRLKKKEKKKEKSERSKDEITERKGASDNETELFREKLRNENE